MTAPRIPILQRKKGEPVDTVALKQRMQDDVKKIEHLNRLYAEFQRIPDEGPERDWRHSGAGQPESNKAYRQKGIAKIGGARHAMTEDLEARADTLRAARQGKK